MPNTSATLRNQGLVRKLKPAGPEYYIPTKVVVIAPIRKQNPKITDPYDYSIKTVTTTSNKRDFPRFRSFRVKKQES